MRRLVLASIVVFAGALLVPVQAVAASGRVQLSTPILSQSLRVGFSAPFHDTVRVTNTGDAPVTFGSWHMTGTASFASGVDPYATREFTWTTTCPTTLARGQECTIRVTFNATQAGRSKAFGTLVIPHDGEGGETRLEMWGTGTFGLYVATGRGRVYGFGDARTKPSGDGQPEVRWELGLSLTTPIIGGARSASGDGVYLVAKDGGIFSLGDAAFFGSTGDRVLNQPVVGMSATPAGRGYWLVAGDGGIFSFGDAEFHGSTGDIRLNQPVVGMAATTSGRGYWLVASDGGIFAFGDAAFHGSTGDIRLNQPIVDMEPTPSGGGYWLLARDGGVFAFGDATHYGAHPLGPTAVDMAPTPNGLGYWLLNESGDVSPFGDAFNEIWPYADNDYPKAAIVPTAKPVAL